MGAARKRKKNRNIAGPGELVFQSAGNNDFESDAIAMPIAAGEKKTSELLITTLYKSAKMLRNLGRRSRAAQRKRMELFTARVQVSAPRNRQNHSTTTRVTQIALESFLIAGWHVYRRGICAFSTASRL